MRRDVEPPPVDPVEEWVATLRHELLDGRKSCADGAHLMRRDVDGKRCWECRLCGERRPFHIDGEE